MVLTQKELTLIKDLKGQEQLCIDKYEKHAACAHDPQLKQLFARIAGVEREHLSTLTQMENGGNPPAGGAKASSIPTFTAYHTQAETPEKKQDCFLCSDLLATEKHASGLYNTCVFEFGQSDLRKALNHIQTEEQEHGEMIYKYMQANSMYA